MNSSHGKKPVNKVLIVAILILVVFVILGGILFVFGKDTGTFSKNSYINGIEVSGLTPQQAEEHYNSLVEDVEFKFMRTDVQTVVLGSSFDYIERLAEPLDTYLAAQTFKTRIFSYFDVHNYEVPTEITFSEDKLKNATQAICSALNETAQPAVDATIEKSDGNFRIIDEIPGNELLPEPTYEKLYLAAKSSQTDVSLNEANLFKTPGTTSGYLEKNVLAKLDQAAKLELQLDFGIAKEKIPNDLIYKSVDLDTATHELTVNVDVLRPFVVGLAKKYDTLGKTRSFTTTNGAQINIGGGIYGWQLNVNKTLDSIATNIKALKSGYFQPSYTTMAYTRKENNVDIGDTYIEIDLTTQHVWFYKAGELLVSTDVVTGLPGTDRETPTGVYSVWSKETKRYLTGEDYKLWVEYWIPINWTGVGIHDAPWQESFGGDRYLTHGSHGCINTPSNFVSTIYSNVEENTPVLVYKS